MEECAMAQAKRLRAERLQIMLDQDELVAVDDFRFKRRMPSRAAAVRELLKRGLAAEGFALATAGAKSASFGVTEKTPTARR
jgi:acetylglutamate kinase